MDDAKRSGRCLGDGQYRVDLYVNGALAGRSKPVTREQGPGSDGAAASRWARDIGLLACVPTSWDPVPEQDTTAGLVDAFTTADGTSGLVVGRVQFGGTVSGTERAKAVLDWLRGTGFGVVPPGLTDVTDENQESAFFLGGANETTETWQSDEAEYRAQASVTSEGTVLVAILFGPDGFLAADDARANGSIGLSLIRMDDIWGLRQPAPR